jgi:uncharacterized protein YwqG
VTADDDLERSELEALLREYGLAYAELSPELSLRLLAEPGHDGDSWLGGVPSLPAGIEWPTWRTGPLAFVAALSLAEVHAALPEAPLPSSGSLLLFFDQHATSWGLEPGDEGNGRVLFVPAGEEVAATEPPQGLAEESRWPRRPLRLAPEWTLPDLFSERVEALGIHVDRKDEYAALLDALALRQAPRGLDVLEETPQHRLLGHPALIQDEPEIAEVAGEGPEDSWRLLLQIDSEPELDMWWGDAGRLYVYARAADDVIDGRARTWTVLQST